MNLITFGCSSTKTCLPDKSRGHNTTPIGGYRFGNVEFDGGDSIHSISLNRTW